MASIKSSIHHGIFTLNDLSGVIDANLFLAHKLDIHIKYRITNGGAITAELHRDGLVIHKENYAGKFLHLRLANMHADLHEILHGIRNRERAEREKQAREKAQAEALEKMPWWQRREGA